MTPTLLAANLVSWTAQTTIVIAAALALLALLRMSSPDIRYMLLRILLLVCLALPVAQPRITMFDSDLLASLSLAPGAQARAANARGNVDAPARPAPSTILAPSSYWAAGLLALVATGVIVRLAWMSLGIVRLRRLRDAGEIAAHSPEHDELQKLIGSRARIRYVAGLGQPLTFGFRHPVVLLPQSLAALPEGIQRAVLAHELWHVRRRDWLLVLLEELLRAAFWFHPAMWVLLSRIQAAREEVVDELTVLLTGSRRNYLDALMAFADRPSLFAAAAFARRRHLVSRILLISKESVMSSKHVVVSCAVMAAVVAGAGWAAVSAFPLTAPAQMPRDRMPPPPPPDRQARVNEEMLVKKAQEQPNAANYTALAILNWEKAFRGHDLTAEERARLVSEAIAHADSALAYDNEYVTALVYKNILLRMQAEMATEPEERKRLVAEADLLRTRALELRKSQPVTAPPPGMPPPPPPPPPPMSKQVDGEWPIRVGGNVKTPVKIRHVRPVYPPEAQAERVQGVVIVELTIDKEGKVRDAFVLRSIPMLDEAALEAVRQWEFVPTLLNGAPVPVIMTVTVNFVLE